LRLAIIAITTSYLGHLPAITSDFTDYELMQRQVSAFRDMELALAHAPADQLGVLGH
jgi:hypothetical protein